MERLGQAQIPKMSLMIDSSLFYSNQSQAAAELLAGYVHLVLLLDCT